MRIHSCYDNGGETIDRYSVFFTERDREFYMCLGMSNYPDHPQGFCQWTSGTPGTHCGRKVRFSSLPGNIKVQVYGLMAYDEPIEPLYDEGGKLYEPTEADKSASKIHRDENRMFYIIGGV